MKGKYRKQRRVEPTDVWGAGFIITAFIIGVVLVGLQVGFMVSP